jgi:phage terminase large subunit-like protein
MKGIIVILMLLASVGSYAGCENSTLVIHTNSGLPVKVYIDGSTGRNRPTQGVTVNGLTPGRHLLRVVAVYNDEYGYTQRRQLFNGYINVRPSRYMDAYVEEGRGVSIHESRQPCDEEYGTRPVPHNDGGYENNHGSNDPDRYDPDAPHSSQSPPLNTYSAPANDGNLPAHVSDNDFEQMKSTIENTKYETKKMDTLKVLVIGQRFATSQVSVLMNLFAFESNKLEVAKLLYDKTVDKQNYHRLASNFNFDARKEDFRKFMVGK